jgi:hypothetical protein
MSEKLDALKENRSKIAGSLESAQTMFDMIDGVVKSNKEQNKGWIMARDVLAETKAAVEKLDKQIADEEATAATAAIIQPLVTAFGTVSIKDGTNAPTSFHLVDVEKELNAARGMVEKGQDRIKLYERVTAAVTKAGLPEGTTIERPIHFQTEGNTVKITIASRGGGRSGTGNGGTRSTGTLVRIIEAKDPQFVGQTVGTKEADYASWRDFLAKNDAEHFAVIEENRKKGSNYSARVVAEKRFEIKTEEMAKPEAVEASAETAEVAAA